MKEWELHLGDCRQVLPTLPAGSFDLVFTDPPYPCIKRSYGTWTEAGWWELMRAVVPECMRVLKPTGSAVFVLQPNSERVGRMRTWHLKFQLWVAETWGIVQDAYWWNYTAPPVLHCTQAYGLMKPSVKPCAWVGPEGCYRNQAGVLWDVSSYTVRQAMTAVGRAKDRYPSGHVMDKQQSAQGAIDRGGAAPFNLIPCANSRGHTSAGANGHGAGTPLALASFWVRYLCPPGGFVLDPFSGTGTAGLAALKHGCDYVGIERVPEYHATAGRRLADVQGPLFAAAAGGGT